MVKAKVRKSVPLTADDQALLESLRMPGTPEHAALAEVVGADLPEDASEAETLHALLVAGRLAVVERVMISGYAALAAAQDAEDRATRRAMRARAARLGD